MNSKFFTLCTAFSFFAICADAQVGKENIKKQVNDSTRKEQSGKADVYVMGNPIFDAEAIQKEKENSVTKQMKKTPMKKKTIAKKKMKRKIVYKKS